MFRDAKVGDRVWDLRYGWGVVIDTSDGDLNASFMNNKIDRGYYFDGRHLSCDVTPTLFWDEIKIIPPPRPNRKVKKTFWVCFYVNPSNGTLDSYVSFSLEDACKSGHRYNGVDAQKIGGKPHRLEIECEE
ncbi:MAG: hypothetical protein WC248_08405 [Candidatus Methanomethylophilaceae archaeon]|jgi:hypothetical protein